MDEAFRQRASLDYLGGGEERRESTVKMNEDSKTSLLLSFSEEVSLVWCSIGYAALGKPLGLISSQCQRLGDHQRYLF